MDHSVSKPLKEKLMAEGKLGWLIIQFFGWPITALSFFANFEEPYKTVVNVLSILFLTTVVVRSIVRLFDAWETYRAKKIANDERSYQIKQLHRKDTDLG